METVYVLCAFYAVCSCIALGSCLLPTWLQDATTNYGKTKPENMGATYQIVPWFLRLIFIRVPKSWFSHFYNVCAAWSVYLILRYGLSNAGLSSYLVLLQGLRRWYEVVYVQPLSNAQMWIGLYFLGIAYYLVVPLTTWMRPLMGSSLVSFLGAVLFSMGSIVQLQCHSYLATLPKYTLPTKYPFDILIAPHYTAEIVIYTGILLTNINLSTFANLLWLPIDLGVAAESQANWYARKFPDKYREKYRILPMIW